MNDDRLFPVELRPDEVARENRRRATERRQRCPGCGRFATQLRYETICPACLKDERPAIVGKVEQVRRWWTTTRGQVWTS